MNYTYSYNAIWLMKMNNFTKKVILVALFLICSNNIYAKTSQESLQEAQNYILMAGLSCTNYAYFCVEELKVKATKQEQNQLKSFYSQYFDMQVQLCLRGLCKLCNGLHWQSDSLSPLGTHCLTFRSLCPRCEITTFLTPLCFFQS